MFQIFNLKAKALRIISFLYVVFIMVDILILINYIFKDYGEVIELYNIKKAAYIFGTITIVLYVFKTWLSRRIKSDSM